MAIGFKFDKNKLLPHTRRAAQAIKSIVIYGFTPVKPVQLVTAASARKHMRTPRNALLPDNGGFAGQRVQIVRTGQPCFADEIQGDASFPRIEKNLGLCGHSPHATAHSQPQLASHP